MRRVLKALGLAVLFSVSVSSVAFAGEWRTDGNGTWYQNDDNTWPKNEWKEIEDNGVKNWYYFGENGYVKTGYFDFEGYTYYLSSGDTYIHDGQGNLSFLPVGSMLTGWFFDADSGNWHFFNPGYTGIPVGAMLKNARVPAQIEGMDAIIDKDGNWERNISKKHRYIAAENPYLGNSDYELMRKEMWEDLDKELERGFGQPNDKSATLISESIVYSTKGEEATYVSMITQIFNEISDYLYDTYGWETESAYSDNYMADNNLYGGNWNPGLGIVLK